MSMFNILNVETIQQHDMDCFYYLLLQMVLCFYCLLWSDGCISRQHSLHRLFLSALLIRRDKRNLYYSHCWRPTAAETTVAHRWKMLETNVINTRLILNDSIISVSFLGFLLSLFLLLLLVLLPLFTYFLLLFCFCFELHHIVYCEWDVPLYSFWLLDRTISLINKVRSYLIVSYLFWLFQAAAARSAWMQWLSHHRKSSRVQGHGVGWVLTW